MTTAPRRQSRRRWLAGHARGSSCDGHSGRSGAVHAASCRAGSKPTPHSGRRHEHPSSGRAGHIPAATTNRLAQDAPERMPRASRGLSPDTRRFDALFPCRHRHRHPDRLRAQKLPALRDRKKIVSPGLRFSRTTGFLLPRPTGLSRLPHPKALVSEAESPRPRPARWI